MNIFHRKAIELKYKGYTYREISKAIGGKITEKSLRSYFTEGGLLHFDYCEYEAEQNKWGLDEARKEYKRLGATVPKQLRSLYKVAWKNHQYDLCLKILQEMNGQAGMVVVRKTESKDVSENKGLTNEQFNAECKRRGIDPATGLRLRVREDAAFVQPQASN